MSLPPHPVSASAPVASTSRLPPVPPELLIQRKDALASPLSGDQDLVSTFGLLPAYARHVKPYLDPSLFPATSTPAAVQSAPAVAVAAARFTFTLGGTAIGTVDAAGDASSAAANKRQSRPDKNYAALVQDIPGRNTIRKDRHITNLVMMPDFQLPPPGSIERLFEGEEGQQLLRDGFTLLEGEIPGFDSGIWEASQEPKKKKKKRKAEASDLAAAAALSQSAPVGTLAAMDPLTGEEDHRKKKKRKEDRF